MSKVFNMVGGGGGPAASIFVTGLSETDTVTATKGSKTLTGKWTQKSNPLAHGLPDGYTELTYIESTGTQYIDTEVNGAGTLRFEVDCVTNNDVSSSNFGTIFGLRSNSDYNSAYDYALNTYPATEGGSFQSGKANGATCVNPRFVTGERCKISYLGDIFTSSNGTETSYAASDFTSSYNITVFAKNVAGTIKEYGKTIIYSLKLYSESTLIRNFIPSKRNSDSVIGLYDLVTSTFFENAGTGTFTAGAEVPQTIDGFLISKIKDFGTWTVNATNGTNTATQDVLVDVITEYVIYMELKNYLMLYDFGDECEDVTGGWTDGLLNDNNNIYPYLRYIRTQLRIDASEYTKCAINVSFGNSTDIGGNGILVGDTPPNVQSWRALNPSDIQTSGLSVHNMNANEGYFHIGVDNGTMTSNSVTKNQNNIYVYTRSGSSFVRELYMYNFALCKQDDWLTLCTKAGITAPSDLATLIADTTSIAAILANEEAVKFAVSNCTGDFMVSFVASSACLTALTSSPYESVIRANRHWAKFLAMVQ